MRRNFNHATTGRRSTGALYSAAELNAVEGALTRRGFEHTSDDANLGVRIYKRPDGACATIYLDELKCDPMNCGIMFVTGMKEVPSKGTTVAAYAHEVTPGIKGAIRAAIAPFFPKK